MYFFLISYFSRTFVAQGNAVDVLNSSVDMNQTDSHGSVQIRKHEEFLSDLNPVGGPLHFAETRLD